MSTTQPTLSIPEARATLPPADFRLALRRTMLDHPDLTLKAVAEQLNITRQRVALMVGLLNRPSCAHPDKPAPKRDAARAALAELKDRVRAGEPAQAVVKDLGISLTQAMNLGFRVKLVRPSHGTQARLRSGCTCLRCRRAGGLVVPRGKNMTVAKKFQVLDWRAWCDPDTGEGLRQVEIGRLSGVPQPMVSRIMRTAEAGE